MMFVLTFLLVAGLEIAAANNSDVDSTPVESPEEPDMCIGCEDKIKNEEEEPAQQLTVEIRIDPITGKILYVIDGLVIE